MNSAASPALGFPPRAKKKCSSPRASRKASTRRRGSTAESRLRALGVTPKLSYAIRYWVGTHGRDENFSAPQLALEGLCHPSCFSRGKVLLLGQSLIVQVSAPVAPNQETGGKGLAALYRFTEAAYLLVLGGQDRRAKRTSPLSFRNHSKDTTYPEHKHVPGNSADAPVRESKAPSGVLQGEPGPVVELLLQDGLDRPGALAVAKVLPPEVGPELLPFVLEVTREVIAKRRLRNQTPEGLKVHLLRCLDPEVLREACSRQQVAQEWGRGATGVDLGGVAKAFRSQPGFTRVMDGYQRLKTALQGVQKESPGYLALHDQAREARLKVLDLIRTAAGSVVVAQWEAAAHEKLQEADIVPGSLYWTRGRNAHLQAAAFHWAGLR